MDAEIRVGLPAQTNGAAQGHATAKLSLKGLPLLGTLCQAAPPPAVDVLHGPPAPGGLLRGDGPADVLHGGPVRGTPPDPAPP